MLFSEPKYSILKKNIKKVVEKVEEKQKKKLSKKWIVVLIAVLVVLIGFGVRLLLIQGANDRDYENNLEKVTEYANENHPDSEMIHVSRIPNVKRIFNVSDVRADDMFIFYDKKNDNYYELIYEDGKILSDYDKALFGKTVTANIETAFKEHDYDIPHMLRGWVEEADAEDGTYYQSKLQLFFLTDDVEKDLDEIFAMIKHVKDTYPGIYCQLMISPTSEKIKLEKLFSFEEVTLLMHMEQHYSADIFLDEYELNSKEDLITMFETE